MTFNTAEKVYTITSSPWMIADTPSWRHQVLHTTFARAGELLIEKIGEVQTSSRALTDEEQEALVTAFKNFLAIHTVLHAETRKEE